MAKRRKYQKRSDDEKQAILAEFAGSDLTLRDFCREHNISSATLYSWKNKPQRTRPAPTVSNGRFVPQSDSDLLGAAMKEAAQAAKDCGMSPERFTADAIRFALARN